jgi:mono/diheme cytochrome c family protein
VSAIAVLGFGLFVLTGQQPATPPTVYTSAQAEAGQAAYASSCQKCHTETLIGRDGTGDIPEFLQPYAGKIPPLAGTNSAFIPFLTKWGPQKTDVLYRRIREAVGGFPPPGRKLDEELCLQLTAYVLQVNGARPGTQPLTAATTVEIRSITSTGR